MTEIRAGLTTFFAMAYIIAVNASIVSDSGGTCVCAQTAEDPTCDKDQTYLLCIQDIKQDIVTATAAISALACVAMGIAANLYVGPLAVVTMSDELTFVLQGRLLWHQEWVCLYFYVHERTLILLVSLTSLLTQDWK